MDTFTDRIKQGVDDMAKMKSRFPGSCNICGKSFPAGEDIDYDKSTRSATHWDCKQAEKPIPADLKTYKLGGGSGYGYSGWTVGQVVATKKNDREEKGWPEYLYVIRASSEYVREDGLSFGVGEDRGYYYRAICREATEQEAAPVIEAQKLKAEREAALARLQEIKHDIISRGEWPQGPDGQSIVLDGERLHGKPDIYGGGDWFVITSDHIWHVQNNGADGDDWGRNNIRTGGAGAIGFRVPYTEELAMELRTLQSKSESAKAASK